MTIPRTCGRLAAALAVLGASLLPAFMSAGPAHAAAAPKPILGGGSGFAALELDQWRADTARNPYNLNVNYSSQGSSVGRVGFSQGAQHGGWDFGATDIVFPPQTEAPLLDSTTRCGVPLRSCFRYVPVSAGGLGFMYNLTDNSGARIRDLKLTRRDVCKIFTGQIQFWNQLEGTKLNNSSPIRPIVRGDGAGESYVLSEFCMAVAPDIWNSFKGFVLSIKNPPSVIDPGLGAGQPTSNWPAFLQWDPSGNTGANTQSGADGVANAVADPNGGPNTITYDAAGYAKVRDFPVASVQNANPSIFTQPDETNVTVALGYAQGRGDGTFILNFDGPDTRAYFPSTYSYILAQTTPWDPGKAAALSLFLCYAVGPGQVIAPPLRYARLSLAIVNISIAAINQIPGASCVLTGPPPPPPPQVQPKVTAPSIANASRNGAGGGGANGAAGSTTTAAGAGTTAATGTSGTSGTSGPSGASGEAAGPAALASSPADSTKGNGPSNDQALWVVIEGAAVSAIAMTLTGRRRRAAG